MNSESLFWKAGVLFYVVVPGNNDILFAGSQRMGRGANEAEIILADHAVAADVFFNRGDMNARIA